MTEADRRAAMRDWLANRITKAEFRARMDQMKRDALARAIARGDPRVGDQRQLACAQIVAEFQRNHKNVDEEFFRLKKTGPNGERLWDIVKTHQALEENLFLLRDARQKGSELYKIL